MSSVCTSVVQLDFIISMSSLQVHQSFSSPALHAQTPCLGCVIPQSCVSSDCLNGLPLDSFPCVFISLVLEAVAISSAGLSRAEQRNYLCGPAGQALPNAAPGPVFLLCCDDALLTQSPFCTAAPPPVTPSLCCSLGAIPSQTLDMAFALDEVHKYPFSIKSRRVRSQQVSCGLARVTATSTL